MALKFNNLTRPNTRSLESGEKIIEHGITFDRQVNGDGRYTVSIMVDGQRIHRVIGRESEGVTRQQAEDYIQSVRTEARHGRLNLPKGRKLTIGFRQAAKKYLQKLKSEVPPGCSKYIHLLERSLEGMASSFGRKISQATLKLTPREIEISNMIKNGLTSKDIANLLHLSLKTINRHRQNIRRKCNIRNQKINLATFLQSL